MPFLNDDVIRQYWALSRPPAALLIAATPLVGYGFALWEHAAPARHISALPSTIFAWWLVHVGAIWLNARLDRDENQVLWGAPTPIPPAIGIVAYSALVLAVVIATATNLKFGLVTLGSGLLAAKYSSLKRPWKGSALGGPLTNCVGYGLISPGAGWLIADVAATPRTVVVAMLLTGVALSVYFFAQVFQQAEDRARGYRTLVATHGPRAVVLATRLCLGFAFSGVVTLSILGWLPLVCALVLPGWLWLDRWLGAHRPRFSERDVRVYVLSLLCLGAQLMLLALADFCLDPDTIEVAGQGTRCRW